MNSVAGPAWPCGLEGKGRAAPSTFSQPSMFRLGSSGKSKSHSTMLSRKKHNRMQLKGLSVDIIFERMALQLQRNGCNSAIFFDSASSRADGSAKAGINLFPKPLARTTGCFSCIENFLDA